MNDWWNDPPDEDCGPQCPECCGDAKYLTGNHLIALFECCECGVRWAEQVPEDPEPLDFEPDISGLDDDLEAASERCPHGNRWEECNACMVAGDMAYDASRERRR